MPSQDAPVRLTDAWVTEPMLALFTIKSPTFKESTPRFPTTPPGVYFSEKLRATTCKQQIKTIAHLTRRECPCK